MDAVSDVILQAAGSPWLYLALFALATIDGFFPPVPSEAVIVAAAAIAMTNEGTNLWLLGIAGACGAVLGDNIAYSIGKRLDVRKRKWGQRRRVASAFNRAERTLRRRGALLILGARYIPVGRIAVNMTAGTVGYPRRRFFFLTIVAAVTWAAYSVAIGAVAGAWMDEHPLIGALLGIALAVVIGFVIEQITRWRERKKERAAPAQENLPAQEPLEASENAGA